MTLRVRAGTKKLGYYFCGLFLFYLLLIRDRRVSEKFEIVVNDVDPKTLWEYWADFSNFQKLNPVVTEFAIEDERGTYENWEYRVSYWEVLMKLPLPVFTKARFIVTPEQTKGHFSEPFTILSEHDTCFWIFCTHSDSKMTFTKVGKSKATKISETVAFGSPLLLRWYYVSEFRAQRELISSQLQLIDFSNV